MKQIRLLVHIVKANLVELIDSHGDIYDLLCLANYLSDAGKDLTVIDLDESEDEHPLVKMETMTYLKIHILAYRYPDVAAMRS